MSHARSDPLERRSAAPKRRKDLDPSSSYKTAISRYKALIGPSLRARTLPAQKTEARAACAVLNRMTRLGMPVSQRVA